MTARFIDPHPDYAASYVAAIKNGLDLHPASATEIRKIQNSFREWLHDLNDLSKPVMLPDGTTAPKIPQTLRWLVQGDHHFIGRVAVRHYLNEPLRNFGGHIGYSIRPPERRKGYGQMLIHEGLRILKDIGEPRALVTCNDDNFGSIKIIKGAGGILEKTAICSANNGKPLRYYWINL